MKVTKLHIDEYKVFKDFDIDFTNEKGEAQNLIVLAGINGTGKTTLLEFILNSILSRYTKMGGERIGNSSIEFFHKPDDYLFAPNTYINFTTINESHTRVFLDQRLLHDGDKSSTASGNSPVYFFGITNYDFGYFSSDAVDIVKSYIDKYIYDDQLRSNEVYVKLRDFINSIFSDFSLGFKFKRYSSEHSLYFETLNGTEVSLFDLSSGERQLFNFALSLFVADIKNSIILIDEPEFSLHPSWQNKIVGVLQKYADEYNCQVILATHSPHIIGSVRPEQLRLLYKDESGAIKVVEHSPNAYGLTFDRVLTEVMGVENLRTPDVDKQLKELSDLVKRNQYESEEFLSKMKGMENLIGYSDGDLILMRFEIAKRKKLSAANQ